MATKKKKATSLVLRNCDANLRSYRGFQWPDKVGAQVDAPDFDSSPVCGKGLHGWLYGAGDSSASNNTDREDAKWLVLEVESESIVMLGGKCKFPRCKVRHIGDMQSATAFIIANESRCAGVAVIGASVTAGYSGTATAGDRGTATAGYRGTATAGYRGTATAGDRGTATAGDSGTATAGDSGTATAGNYGTLCIRYYDSRANRYRTAIAYVGEDGIEAGKKYRLNDQRKFVLCS